MSDMIEKYNRMHKHSEMEREIEILRKEIKDANKRIKFLEEKLENKYKKFAYGSVVLA